MSVDHRPDALLKGITVQKLFGMYSYDLRFEHQTPSGAQLSILYGHNGSGKTTLLRLIQRMLSPEPKGGHRNFVLRVPFSFLQIDLHGDTSVRVEREHGIEGPMRAALLRDGARVVEARYADRDEAKTPEESLLTSDDMNDKFCGELSRLGFRLNYLSDDRRVSGNPRRARAARVENSAGWLEQERAYFTAADEEVLPVEVVVGKAETWIRRQALRAVDRGSSNANYIYTEVVEKLAGIITEQEPAQDTLPQLAMQVTEVAKRNEEFAQFGLSPTFDPGRLEQAIYRARPGSVAGIQAVLRPYLDGLRARLDALQPIQQTLATLIGHLNTTFLQNKFVSYDLARGFTINTATGTELQLKQLSSGEKQLLLLLATVIASHDTPTLFLIDEPEISLNVKWQRGLVAAMLDCMEATRSQLILASHSLELISRYRANVVHLTPPEQDREQS